MKGLGVGKRPNKLMERGGGGGGEDLDRDRRRGEAEVQGAKGSEA